MQGEMTLNTGLGQALLTNKLARVGELVGVFVPALALIIFVASRYLRSSSIADQPIAFGDALSAAQTASQVYEEELEQQTDDA